MAFLSTICQCSIILILVRVQNLSKCICKMPRNHDKSASVATTSTADNKETANEQKDGGPQRSAYLWLALFILLLNGSWAVHHYQNESLPLPVNVEQAGKRGFSEVSAMEHVKHLTELGPHPIGSNALDLALQVHVFLVFKCY